jgi:hypothetical protein
LLALRCCHWLADRRLSPTRLTNHNQVRPTNCLPLLKAARTQPQQDPAEIDYLELLLLGLKLERASVFEAAGTLPRFQKLAESLAATLPELDQGGPLRVLGMLHLRAPQWPAGPGDLDRALELLGAAASNYPAHPDNHLFLAEALLEDDDPEGAASALAAAQAAVPPTWPIWRQRRWQDGARTYHLSLPPPTPPPQP